MSDHHAIAPILHNLTHLHSNDPNLTLHPTFDLKKLRQAFEVPLRKEDVGSNDLFPPISQADLTSISDLRQKIVLSSKLLCEEIKFFLF
jgi:hypothetical protein